METKPFFQSHLTSFRHPLILADQLTLSLPGGADYFHQILVLAPPDLHTALSYIPYCTFRLRKSEKLEKIEKSLWKRLHEVFDLNLMTIIRINDHNNFRKTGW